MASIRKRKKKDGSLSYMAEISIKRNGKVVHRESRTFALHKLAKSWAAKRELEIDTTDVFGKHKPVYISTLIGSYLDQFDSGRSKRYDLLRLQESEISKLDAYDLTPADLIKHCSERNKTAKPQTVKNDLIWLKSVLDTMKASENHKYSTEPFTSANKLLRREGLIASTDKRVRRPSRHELTALSRFLTRKNKHYLHILWFAIFSARRLSEITQLKWSDINHEKRTILVRDIKSPSKKELSLRAKIPKSAYKVIMKQPKKADQIFPYNPKTISTTFTRACKMLGIDDLHFHDLRREAISRLFEHNLSIVEVQQVSLHQSWSSLSVYTKINPEDVDI